MVRVKICCISSVEEAALAVRHGAAALGLVGRMPSGPGVIDDRLIAEIAASTPPPVATFLLTSETTVLDCFKKLFELAGRNVPAAAGHQASHIPVFQPIQNRCLAHL